MIYNENNFKKVDLVKIKISDILENVPFLASKESMQANQIALKLRVNKRSSEPYYLQLKKQIEHLIANDDLIEGTHLPPERVLADSLNISRTTVKHCYNELRNAGLISSNGRNGTTIQRPPRIAPALGKLKGFTEEMRELGMTASTQLQERNIVTDRTMATLFGRPASAEFLRLVRIRSADDLPMTREVAWYDLTSAPRLKDWDCSGSVYDYLKNFCDVSLSEAEQSIEAALSTPEETKVFGFEKSEPCLFLTRKTFSDKKQLTEYVEGTFRGDAYTYRLKLTA